MQKGFEEGLRELQDQLVKSFGFDISQLMGQLGTGKMPGFDPYKVLGLDPSASDEEIKKRYRDLLRRLHPDTSGIEGTEFLMQLVVGAYEMIKRERGWL